MAHFSWPLMANNITDQDLDCLIKFLKSNPKLTQSENVAAFEKEWSDWLGVKYSLFVNSGSSANLITMAALNHHFGPGEVIVPPLTWVSDIAAVLQNGFKPVFVDINPQNLCMKDNEVIQRLSDNTRAVFMTHIQGFCGLTQRLLSELEKRSIPLIEDVCESHGATFEGRKLGTFGMISNFSFYFAHHMSTIEGGMVCTNDESIYETLRMMRSHGLVRELASAKAKSEIAARHPDLNPDFIFSFPAYNVRNTEIGAVLGRSQLKRLDENNQIRKRNLKIFLNHLDDRKYRTDFDLNGSCNYAFNLILKNPDPQLRDRVEDSMRTAGIEFRRGSSGGGNQLRQPYLKTLMPENEFEKYPEVEHVHFYGYYIGNHPEIEPDQIRRLCDYLNRI